MNSDVAQKALKVLFAAYPNATVSTSTEAVYVKSLMDFTEDEARRAINVAIATSTWLPSVSFLRELVVEERLQLPRPTEAWEEVQARLTWKPSQTKIPCVRCAGVGTELDDGRGGAETACKDCNGAGGFPDPAEQPPSFDDVTKRTVDFCGGLLAIRQSDSPHILRAQFQKAHADFRSEAIREANLVSLGVLAPAAKRVAIEARTA